MRTISIEEHWTTAGIDRALRAQPPGLLDESLVLNDRGDIPARLLDIGEPRIAAMDRAGVDVQIISIAPPGTGGLATAEAVALSGDANDQARAAIESHPTRFRALTTLPLSDPVAAIDELQRSATMPGHVGVMAYGRSGERPLDDPAYDELLGAAASLGRPVFIHPQIPLDSVRKASYSGFDHRTNLALATFGWGWHIEAGIATLPLIARGTFDRHPDLHVVLGHWGEMVLFALDRVGSLANVTHLERPVSDYFLDNIHITSSGMYVPRLLRHALDYTGIDRILLSGDYPFHPLEATTITDFLATLPADGDRHKLAHSNAETLFDLKELS